ncbi:MAG: hypothetical protein QOF51_164 [Chloroflexota bacterium]|nr:hypothetical protein [Chloroflexota bacterium]
MRETSGPGFDRLLRLSLFPAWQQITQTVRGGPGATRRRIPALLAVVGTLVLATSQSISSAAPVAQESRNLTVLVGAGRDTDDVFAFFPQNIRVHAGDSITWDQNSDSAHTISFGTSGFPGPAQGTISLPPGQTVPAPVLPIAGRPGVNQANPSQYYPFMSPEIVDNTWNGVGFASSGRLTGSEPQPGLPRVVSFSLTFDTPGTYQYRCLIHGNQMYGTVEVVDATATAPSQAEIDTQAEAEQAVLTALLPAAHAQNPQAGKAAGANGTSVWSVQAGNTQAGITDLRVQVLEFMPKNVTITAGDTVLWTSSFAFHTVGFFPVAPPPPDTYVDTAADGSTIVVTNPDTANPHKPADVFDPRQAFTSGRIGYDRPAGNSWTLIFDTPGVYDYICAVHGDRGMKGTITVLPRA